MIRREYKRVLCVCAQAVSRSPTAAWVLGNTPYHYNTRSAGVDKGALIPVSQKLIDWADEIVVMKSRHEAHIMHSFNVADDKPIHILYIDDDYSYRDPDLADLIRKRYDSLATR